MGNFKRNPFQKSYSVSLLFQKCISQILKDVFFRYCHQYFGPNSFALSFTRPAKFRIFAILILWCCGDCIVRQRDDQFSNCERCIFQILRFVFLLFLGPSFLLGRSKLGRLPLESLFLYLFATAETELWDKETSSSQTVTGGVLQQFMGLLQAITCSNLAQICPTKTLSKVCKWYREVFFPEYIGSI